MSSNRHTAGDRTWAAWAAATLGSFAVLEALACSGRFPTLSATLSRWLGVHPPTRWGQAAPFAFGAAWLWLTLHVARYQPRVVLVSEADAVAAAEQITRDAAKRWGRGSQAG